MASGEGSPERERVETFLISMWLWEHVLTNNFGKKLLETMEESISALSRVYRVNPLIIIRELCDIHEDEKCSEINIGLIVEYLEMLERLSMPDSEGHVDEAWGPGFIQPNLPPEILKGPLEILRAKILSFEGEVLRSNTHIKMLQNHCFDFSRVFQLIFGPLMSEKLNIDIVVGRYRHEERSSATDPKTTSGIEASIGKKLWMNYAHLLLLDLEIWRGDL